MVCKPAPPTYIFNIWRKLTSRQVEFRIVVFRPFKGEVLLGRITSGTQGGITSKPGGSCACLPACLTPFPFSPSPPGGPPAVIISDFNTPLVVRTDFFNDIFVPFTELPEEAT